MKLEKTIDGLFAAPVTSGTIADVRLKQELEAEVLANVPDLAEFLALSPKSNAQPAFPLSTYKFDYQLTPPFNLKVEVNK